MKLNPSEWSVAREKFQAKGVVRLRGQTPFAVRLSVDASEVVLGEETQHTLYLDKVTQVVILSKQPVYMKAQPSRVVHPTGEVFTNIDRLPNESGTVAEVTKALRMLKLEERAMIRRIREEIRSADEVIEPRQPRTEGAAENEAEAEAEAEGAT